MKFETQLRDCLFLNWALEAGSLPEPPASLRWERHPGEGGDYVFASALLFRQAGLRWSALPQPRLSYPQLNLRLYVLDEEDVPSVLFLMMLVPSWVLPAARWMARQPAESARFKYPAPGRGQDEGSAWRVSRQGDLRVTTRVGAPSMGKEPDMVSWPSLVDRLRQRKRGYTSSGSGLRRVEARQPRVEVVPVHAELERCDLLPDLIGGSEIHWPELHSAWFCPCLPYIFEVGPSLVVPVPRRRAAPLGNCTHGATRRMS